MSIREEWIKAQKQKEDGDLECIHPDEIADWWITTLTEKIEDEIDRNPLSDFEKGINQGLVMAKDMLT